MAVASKTDGSRLYAAATVAAAMVAAAAEAAAQILDITATFELLLPNTNMLPRRQQTIPLIRTPHRRQRRIDAMLA